MNDFQFAFRQIVKRPGSSVVMLATLALVMGTLSFAIGMINRQRADRTPFPEPDRIVRLWRVGTGRPSDRVPGRIFTEAGPGMPGFEALGAIGPYDRFVLTGQGEPKALVGVAVSASVFDVAGVQPAIGRVFSREDERSGQRCVVLGHELWSNIFGSEESIIGRPVRLNEGIYIVMGVMPRGFERNALFASASVWVNSDGTVPAQTDPWLEIVGRMKRGVTRAQIDAQLQAVAWPVGQAYAQAHHWQEKFPPLTAQPITRRFGRPDAPELVLAGMIPALVALIAGFNVTTILLGRMMAHRQELALRTALGARRGRLVRLLLTESVVLALAGAAVGTLGAYWLSAWTAQRGMPADFGPAVVGLIVLAAVGIGIATGLAPALRVTRCSPIHDLKEAGAGSGGPARHRLRNFLVAGQVAMTTALCVAAGLLTRSYIEMKRFDPGFATDSLVSVVVTPREPAYKDPQPRMLYCEQVLERLRSVPGVRDVSVSSGGAVDRLPFPESFSREGAGAPWAPGQIIHLQIISPNHLGMLSVPVLRGRGFREDDRPGGEPVLLVNQAFVRRYFPDTDPLGRRIGLREGEGGGWFTIVGIVPDRRNVGYREDYGPEGYLCTQQVAPRWASYHFLTRTHAYTASLGTAIRQAVLAVDPEQPVSQPCTVASLLQRTTERHSGSIAAISAIGFFALLMSLIGIYGVASHAVLERTHEIGVRVSLGATQGAILRLILRQSLRLVVIGLTAGVLLASAISVGLDQLLFGIARFDPATYLGVSGLLAATALLASLVPARRAARLDPMAALRCE